MELTDEIKILDDKIKANQARYNLNGEAAKISELSSKNLLDKYEYLTGEDLGYKPSVFQKTKFEYSPLGMSLNKAFKKMSLKVLGRSRVISIMIAIMLCTGFNKLLISFKGVKKKQKHNSKRS